MQYPGVLRWVTPTLRPPEVKLCVVQREHIVENRCDLILCASQDFISMQFIQSKSFWTFIMHSAFEDILHFLNPAIYSPEKLK